jgi:hypothetical protein
MQLSPRLADAVGQLALDAHVNVFQLRLETGPLRAVAVDLGFDFLEAFDDRIALGIGEEADLGEHGGVGDGAGDVVSVETPVVGDRFDELLGDGVGRFGDAGLPRFLGVGHGEECNLNPCVAASLLALFDANTKREQARGYTGLMNSQCCRAIPSFSGCRLT